MPSFPPPCSLGHRTFGLLAAPATRPRRDPDLPGLARSSATENEHRYGAHGHQPRIDRLIPVNDDPLGHSNRPVGPPPLLPPAMPGVDRR